MGFNNAIADIKVQAHESGFAHVTSAMRLNFTRGLTYCRLTGGRSLFITVPLILTEAMTALVLGFYDLWGKWFNRAGIAIVESDFMPMNLAKSIDTPLRYTGRATKLTFKEINTVMKRYQREAMSATLVGDFHKVARLTKQVIIGIIRIEDETQSLFAMHRHLLESIGFAAVNGIQYQKESDGRTSLLSKCFILTQMLGLTFYCPFDSLAQVCHGYDAGIIENDVPYIPFLERFKTLSG